MTTRAGVDTATGLGRAGFMDAAAEEFPEILQTLLARFCTQNAQTPLPAAEMAAFGARLQALIAARGWPRPLAAGETGAPGGLPEAEVEQLAAQLAGEGAGAFWHEVARQLVKACFYPEFTVCRDSFRAVGPDGACRRQQVERVRGRISGSYCVDCPHWVARAPAEHAALLAREWRGDAAVLAEHEAMFLPQDFGALRRWRHAAVRR